MTSVDFRVVVYEPTDYDWFLRPVFEVDLADQEVSVNTSLRYQPDFKIEPNGWQMTLLQINLGRSNKFTKYDSETRTFFCEADLVEQVDLGQHLITIEVRFVRNYEI